MPTRHLLDPHAGGQARSAALRALGTVVPAVWPGGVECWAVVGHRELETVLTRPLFARSPAHWRALAQGEVPPDWPMIDHLSRQWMLTSDGADHTRLRKVASRAFTPRRVEALRPAVEEKVAHLLDGFDPGREPVDIRAGFATPLALGTLSSLLGIPDDDQPVVTALVRRALARASMSPEDSAVLTRDIRAFLDGLLDHPASSDCLVADLREAATSEGLSAQEARDTLWLFLAAGFDTTAAALTNAVGALLDHPAELRRVLDGETSWDDVVEEALRFDPGVFALPFAFPRQDTELGGRTIRAGDALLLCYTAANRDPRLRGDARHFRVSGARDPHLAFGRGPHYCLGAPLAKLQLRTAVRALFTRHPGLRAARPAGPPAASLIVSVPSSLLVVSGVFEDDAPAP
ncbi:cytochrome P450 [Streptomyces sp. NPDC006649]|uniref:cytochrome P450 n=1 Tax=unclassified Streptomyces TaxID=2593676 RepID=UPI00325519E5